MTSIHVQNPLLLMWHLKSSKPFMSFLFKECQDWQSLDCRQNISMTANCSCCCSMKSLGAAANLRQLSENTLQSQPLVIKVTFTVWDKWQKVIHFLGMWDKVAHKYYFIYCIFHKTGQYRSYDEMKHFQSLYPDLINFVIHEDSAEFRSSHPGQGLLFHFFRWVWVEFWS